MSKSVFCDFHHGDLYYSLHLLFEERLGMNLFRPIGLEWFQKGFWKIAEPYGNAADTIDQYLGIPKATWSKSKEPIQKYGEIQLIDDVYHIPLKVGNEQYTQKAITFDTFLKMDFAFVIASYAGHDAPYAELVQKYKPAAIYIRQIGNIFETPKHTRNVLLATNTPMPPGVNYVKYHPEHNREYCYTPPINHTVIKSFIANPSAEPDLPLFYEYERIMPDFTFKIHGILGRDGVISGDLMPQAIRESAFVWHVKQTGCCGFVARQAIASGRPCIIKKHYCYDNYSMSREWFEDSINCIDLDLGTTRENVEKIKYFSEPQRHTEMCKNTADKFKRDVNFDGEATRIKRFLDNLERK
jgi:hypothetical protein